MLAFSTAVTVLGLASSGILALPTKRANGTEYSDTIVLNFALTLEHLEAAFYTKGLELFDEDAFFASGLPDFARGRMVQICENEHVHVKTLTGILGSDATQSCEYSFPLTDAQSFVSLSAIFEGVGAAAYTGAAKLLSDPTHVTEAASILATEARQAAWVMSAVKKQNPWSTSFETPLDLNQAFSLAAAFITSCPSTNPSLPVSAFPSLSITGSSDGTTFEGGSTVTVVFDDSDCTTNDESLFLGFLSGLGQLFAPLSKNAYGDWFATLPTELDGRGTVYALVTNNNVSASDNDTVAGVMVMQFPYNSQAQVVN